MLLIVRLTLFQRQRADFASIDAFAAIEIGLVALMAGLILANPRATLAIWRRMASTSGRTVLLFYSLAIASAAWSELPSFSAFRAVEFAVQVFALFALLSEIRNFASAEKLLIMASLAAISLDMLSLGLKYGFSLAFVRSNSYCASAAILFAYCFGECLSGKGRRRIELAIIAGISFLFILIGQSFASWLAMLVGAAAAMLASRKHRMVAVGLAACLALLLISHSAPMRAVLLPGNAAEKLENLNGRRYLWESYLEQFNKRPILGFGYAVAARTQGGFYATNTHNCVFAVLLGTGLLGVGLCSWAGARLGVECLRSVRLRRCGSVGVLSAILAGLVNAMSLSLLCEGWMPPSFVFVLVYSHHLFFLVSPPPLQSPAAERSRFSPNRGLGRWRRTPGVPWIYQKRPV